MNFMGKNTGGDSGSSNGSRRHHQQNEAEGGVNSFEEDDEEERQNTGPTGQLFPSSSSSSPSSSHHHQQQPPNLHPQPPYQHQNPGSSWMYGSETSIPVTPTPAPDGVINNNIDNDQQSGEGMMMMVEREHMFDKVVTPSDVGKLNRLVIPKQHAERYFPLDSSSNDKGLLLNFEDRNGKSWRFRYSYWNSSQSYVMTKGWSRFVKDKKLDAGDIVSFQRGVGGGSAKDRLFIDWRHRPDAPNPPYQLSPNLSFPLPHHQFSFNRNNIHPWNPVFLQSQPAPSRSHSSLMFPPSSSSSSSYRYSNSTGGPYHNIGTGSIVNVNQVGSGSSVIYFRSGGGSGIPQQMNHRSGVGSGIDSPTLPLLPPPSAPVPSMVFESVPVVHGKAAAKRLRLFGVNMDCPISDDDDQHHHHPPTPSSSSSTIPYQQLGSYEEETEFHQTTMMSSSSTTKSSASRMSLDFGI